MPDIDWSRDRNDEWIAGVAAAQWAERMENEWIKELSCPACEHPMSLLVTSGDLVLLTERLRKVRAVCNCPRKHPGNPDDKTGRGCGRYGLVPGPTQ